MEVNWILAAVTCAFIAMDVISGLLGAIKNHDVSSKIMKQGLYHKCGFLLSMILGALCEWSMFAIDLGFTIPIMPAICGFIILTELASILENLCKITPELSDNKFMSIFRREKN